MADGRGEVDMPVGSSGPSTGLTGFHWASQAQEQMASGTSGADAIQSMMGEFAALGATMSPWSSNSSTGYAELPQFKNCGALDVDKRAGTITTPGGYQLRVDDGAVHLRSPEGPWTELEAEPPNRTIVRSDSGAEGQQTTTVERQLARDPVERGSDGEAWRYAGSGSLHLPDGSKITIRGKGAGTDLHIDQVDVYNGRKHLGIKCQLTASSWETLSRRGDRHGGGWRAAGGQRHSPWRGGEAKAHGRGGQIDRAWLAARPADVPWNVYAFAMTSLTPSLMSEQYARSPEHFDGLGGRYAEATIDAHGAVMTGVDDMGGLRVVFAGPIGGAAMFGRGFSDGFQPVQQASAMRAAVLGLLTVFGEMDAMNDNLSAAWLGSQVLR